MDCLFCKIIAGEIPSQKVYEDENTYAFYDISPQAPTHILVIPKQHIASMFDIDEENSHCMADIGVAISNIAKLHSLEDGFRVITNSGEDACQTVHHLHFHILAGKRMNDMLV